MKYNTFNLQPRSAMCKIPADAILMTNNKVKV